MDSGTVRAEELQVDMKTRNKMIAAVSGLTGAQITRYVEEAYERSDRSWVVTFKPSSTNDPNVISRLNGALSLIVPREVGYEWCEPDLPRP
jgi:secreted Zn-dependent insulinase-like peptidase